MIVELQMRCKLVIYNGTKFVGAYSKSIAVTVLLLIFEEKRLPSVNFFRIQIRYWINWHAFFFELS